MHEKTSSVNGSHKRFINDARNKRHMKVKNQKERFGYTSNQVSLVLLQESLESSLRSCLVVICNKGLMRVNQGIRVDKIEMTEKLAVCRVSACLMPRITLLATGGAKWIKA